MQIPYQAGIWIGSLLEKGDWAEMGGRESSRVQQMAPVQGEGREIGVCHLFLRTELFFTMSFPSALRSATLDALSRRLRMIGDAGFDC